MKLLEHYFPVDTLAPISIDYDYGFTCNFIFVDAYEGDIVYENI